MRRDFLVYVPLKNGWCKPKIFGPERSYDIAVNEYLAPACVCPAADYTFTEHCHKWPGIATNVGSLPRKYKFYAFIDNDLDVSTEDIERLFTIGTALGLDLYQPALSRPSICAHAQLKVAQGSLVRRADFVEVMTPFMSLRAVEELLPLFPLCESGWGLDVVWSAIGKKEGFRMGIVDDVPVGHLTPISSEKWRLKSGMTPRQEMEAFIKAHKPS